MEEELDEFGIPIKPVAGEPIAKKPATAKVEVDEFGIPIKKKEGTTQDSGQPGQPSATSGVVDQASIDRQKTLLYNAKKLHESILKEADQALNDSWDADYTEKHFSEKQAALNQTLDELDKLGGKSVSDWTAGMRSAVGNTKNNIVAQRASMLSFFSDPENLYEEDKGNQEWFGNNVKELEAILSGRQVNKPKEGLPSITAPKKQGFGEMPSLREIVQKPQAEMFKPKEDYNSDRLKLAAYQESADKYKDLERFTKNVDLIVDDNGRTIFNGATVDYDLLSQNEEVWKKYVGEDLPWPGGVYEPNPQKRAAIKKEAIRRIQGDMSSASDAVEETLDTKIVDDIISKNFNEKTYAHFLTTPDESITQPTIDANKISEQVQNIMTHYGLDPKGSAASALYDKAAAAVQYESDKYRIEENFKEEHPEEYNLREKYKSGKFQEEINARFVSELESTFDMYQAQANDEVNAIIGAAKASADELASQYNQQVEQIKQQAQQLGQAYQGGQIDELTYQSELGKLNEQMSILSEQFQSLMPDQGELLEQSNKIYSRYNTAFETRKAAIMRQADEELRKISGGIPADDLEKINIAYQSAYDKAFKDKNSELYRQMKLTSQDSFVSLYMARRSLMNGLGSFIKNMGSYSDSYAAKVFGESMQNKWSAAAPNIEEMGLDTDLYYESQNIMGNMFGNMTPALAVSAGVAVATEGAASGAALSFMTGWISNWATETMSIAGQNGQAVFAKTGDVRRSEKAIARTIDSQQDMFLTYAIDGIPFTKAGYRMVSGFGKGLGADISGRIARGGVGFGVEVLGETFLQEIPQGIAEENIVKNEKDPWSNFGEMYSGARVSETLKGVAPVGVLGFLGGVRTGSLAQQRVDQANAFNNKAILAGGFEDQRRQYLQGLVFDKNDEYARAVVSSLFSTGNITEDEAADMQKQITHAAEIKKTADEQKLNREQRNVYGFFAARADEARRNADKNNQDPILEKMFRQQQAQYERMGADYLQGGSPDMLTLTYSDGTVMMMTPEDARGLSENKSFLDMLAKKQVSVTGYGNTKPILDNIQTTVNDHKTKSAWKSRADAITGLGKAIFAPAKVEIEDRKAPQKAEQQPAAAYNNTADLVEANKMADNFLSTAISNPLWSKLSDSGRSAIKSLAAQIRQDRQLLQNNDPESNEYKQAKERIASNEGAVYDILNGKRNDQEDIQGVPGQVGVGKEPVETQPVEGTGTQATQAGGVLQAQEVVSEDPRERVLQAITEQDFIENAPAITTADIDRINSDEAAKKQAAEKARKEAQSAFDYLDGTKTAKEFLAENGYDVEGMSDEEAKKFADSDVEYWKNKLSAEESKGGKKPTKGKQKGKPRTQQATIAQKEQEMMSLLDKGVQESQDRIKQLIAEGATPDQAYAITENEWKQTEDGKRYAALQEEVSKMSQEKPTETPGRKKKKAEAPKMPEIPTGGQQRIATINALENMIFESATGTNPLSLEQLSEVKAKLAEMKKQNKEGGLSEIESLMKKALGEKVVTMRDVDNMVKEKKVEVKCPPTAKKAEHGMRMGFIPGGKWDIVTEFKGNSHENGGIDIEVLGGRISYTGKEPNLKAKKGGFWKTLKDIGLTVVDTTLGTVGNVAGIKSMQDIIDEDQYENDKFDEAGNFVGKLAGTALKVIPVTAPIAAAAGMAGGAINQIAGIDARNYDPSQHTSKLDQAGNLISALGSVAGMAVTAGTSAGAAKTFAAGDKLSAAQKMSMRFGGINKTLGAATKGLGMIGGGGSQQPQQFLQQTQSNPALQQPAQQTFQNPYQQPQYGAPVQQTYSNSRSEVVTINGVNYAPDQYGNLIPLT